MKKKNLAALTMAAVLAAAYAFPAVAQVVDNNPTNDQHTTIGIMEMSKSPTNVQFEVPLYITMAAKSGAGEMLMPDGYDIKNAAVAGDAQAYDIGVTSMKIEALGDWEIVGATPTGAKQMTFKIGECAMPAIKSGDGIQDVTLAGRFVDGSAPRKIAPGGNLSGTIDGKGLALQGGLDANAVRTADVAATAQFKITYTVAAINDSGVVLGSIYVGDDKTASGIQ